MSGRFNFNGLDVSYHYEPASKGGVHPDEQHDDPAAFSIEAVSVLIGKVLEGSARVYLPREFVEWLAEAHEAELYALALEDTEA